MLILGKLIVSLIEQETPVLLDAIRDLQQHGTTCIYISHKPDGVRAVSDTICITRDNQYVSTHNATGVSGDNIIIMMVGQELTAFYPNRPHTVGDEILHTEHLTAWHPVNRRIERVNSVPFSLRRGEILGTTGLAGAGCTETIQCLLGMWPGQWEGKIYIDDKRVDIRNCQQAIAQGVATVPEDRKRNGIIPVVVIGKSITLTALRKSIDGISQFDDVTEQKYILGSVQQLKVRTSSSDLVIRRLSNGNQQKAIPTCCLLFDPRIPIFNKPTGGIDVGAKYEIYKLISQLVQQGIAVVTIFSELPGVLGLNDRILAMHKGKLEANLINHNLTQEQVMEAVLRNEHHVEKQFV